MNSAAYYNKQAPEARPHIIRRAEDWLDQYGRRGWVLATVAGFLVLWPVGLAFLAFSLVTRKFKRSTWGPEKDRTMFCANRHHHRGAFGRAAYRSSGNSAFDSYKAETLRRLEDEQEAFESFLQRLREAKDKQEFDRFMDERAHSAATQEPDDVKNV